VIAARTRAPLVVVTGTGTGLGKTHLGLALTSRAQRPRSPGSGAQVVAAWKPIESGVVGGVAQDHEALREASSFHVKQDLALAYGLAAAVSPHLAARREGVVIELAPIAERVRLLRSRADLVLVELPGGLFTPLDDRTLNVDLARTLEPTSVLLVARDRLGVLHEVLSTVRAAAAAGVRVSGVALTTIAPTPGDASRGTNAAELERLLGIHVADIPSAAPADLAASPTVERLLAELWPVRAT
jgi:dethiobiotin synthetase